MKTNQLLVKVVMVLLFGGSFVSCNDDDNRMETQKYELEVTEISLKAAAISLVDMQSGVEYATRELKAMGPEYDC